MIYLRSLAELLVSWFRGPTCPACGRHIRPADQVNHPRDCAW